MTRIAYPGLPRLRWLALTAATLAIFAGCSENTVPQITQLDAEPNCDIISTHADGDYLEVRFFARASGGNVKSEPTGANSPLDWSWDFGDGTSAGNVVNPVHRYTQPGEYTVSLVVKDDDGDSDSRTLSIVVGASYGDLDILTVSSETLGDSRLTFTRQDSVNSFDGWEADFDGHLNTPCPIGGLFQTYTWYWEFGDGTFQEHIGTPTHVFPATAESYEVILTVTENNTLVARQDTTQASFPSGVRLSNTEVVVLPGDDVTLTMDGILTTDLNRMDVQFSWPAAYTITATAVATAEVQAEGFVLTADNSVDGVLQLSLQSPSGMSRTDTVLPFAQITFTRPVTSPRVPVGPMTIRLDSISIVTASGMPRASSGIGGDFVIDNDCNDNGVPDQYEEDCNENGYQDSCDIALGNSQDCNGNGVPDECDLANGDALDCNRNGIPDSCEIASGDAQDCNGNGTPDDCEPDCNRNGIADECDISSGTSLDCNFDGIPDECEPDCNENGISDECDISAGTSLDCNDNGVPDECDVDCNNNGIPDECDIDGETSLDCNDNGVPDECEVDCNSNGIPDECDIANGAPDVNGNGIPDECE